MKRLVRMSNFLKFKGESQILVDANANEAQYLFSLNNVAQFTVVISDAKVYVWPSLLNFGEVVRETEIIVNGKGSFIRGTGELHIDNLINQSIVDVLANHRDELIFYGIKEVIFGSGERVKVQDLGIQQNTDDKINELVNKYPKVKSLDIERTTAVLEKAKAFKKVVDELKIPPIKDAEEIMDGVNEIYDKCRQPDLIHYNTLLYESINKMYAGYPQYRKYSSDNLHQIIVILELIISVLSK